MFLKEKQIIFVKVGTQTLPPLVIEILSHCFMKLLRATTENL